MPKPVPVPERAIDLQVAIREARVRHGAPVWSAVMATGDWQALGECQDIDHLLRAAERKAKRVAGRLDARRCADGVAAPGHGAAA